jgi:hypothetical protein
MLISPVKQGEALFVIAPGYTKSCYFACLDMRCGSGGLIIIRPQVGRDRRFGARCPILRKPRDRLCY